MITDHESRALGHARIVEFHKFFSEYQLWLESDDQRFRVKIRIYETNDGRFFFVQSHFIQTPMQGPPGLDAQATYDAAHVALGTAVDSITTYYDEAVAKGHQPTPDWFVLNSLF